MVWRDKNHDCQPRCCSHRVVVISFGIEGSSCFSAKPIERNWIPPCRMQKWDFIRVVFQTASIDLRSMAICKFVMTWKTWKVRCQSYQYVNFFFLVLKDRRKTTWKRSSVKSFHIKKYWFLKVKAGQFKNAIDFVWGRFLCKWPKPDDDRFIDRPPVKVHMPLMHMWPPFSSWQCKRPPAMGIARFLLVYFLKVNGPRTILVQKTCMGRLCRIICSKIPGDTKVLSAPKETYPWQPQLVGWYECRPLHKPGMVFGYCSEKKWPCLAPKRSSCSGTACCSQPLSSELRCVLSLKVLLSCHWGFWGSVVVIFRVG